MDLYSHKAAALPQKATVAGLELLLLLLSAVILFSPVPRQLAAAIGLTLPTSIPARRVLIFAFSCITFLRMNVTLFYLMKRAMPWQEAFTVPFAFALYYIGFALLVLPSDAPLGVWDGLAVVLFAVGCLLNTGGELGRDRFKKDLANAGRLYTGGLFALSMHINFFGDVVWIAAYAIVTQTPWAWLIPLFTLSFFAFYNVPMLDRHLLAHYGAQFDSYRARTKRLIPFVW